MSPPFYQEISSYPSPERPDIQTTNIRVSKARENDDPGRKQVLGQLPESARPQDQRKPGPKAGVSAEECATHGEPKCSGEVGRTHCQREVGRVYCVRTAFDVSHTVSARNFDSTQNFYKSNSQIRNSSRRNSDSRSHFPNTTDGTW